MGNCCGVNPTLNEDHVYNTGNTGGQSLEASTPTNAVTHSQHTAETSGYVSSSHMSGHMTPDSLSEQHVEAEPKVLEHIADREGWSNYSVVCERWLFSTASAIEFKGC